MRTPFFAWAKLLSFLVVAGLAGCGGQDDPPSPQPQPQPQPQTYTVSVNVTGLGGSLVLRLNGGSDLTVSAPGNATFGSALGNGTAYTVTVASQPAAQTCTVTAGGTGTIAGANVSNVAISCTNNIYTIGGTLSGLNGTVVLQNNGGNNLSLSANGNFTFATPVASGAAYGVTVLTQPAGQICIVTNGVGNATSNVTNVTVACASNAYSIGGTLSGLNGTVVLQNNGGNNLSLSANGNFTFATPVASGAAYGVTVLTQPAGQTCTVTNGVGNAIGNVTNVTVICASSAYSIGGTLGGLNGTVVLQNNGGNSLTLTANGTFVFGALVARGGAYSVTVLTQPVGQTCTVANASGTALASVTNVTVTCSTNTYTIGGMLSGLSGTVVLQNNGGNNLSVASNGGFTFSAPVPHGTAYNVTVLTQPVGQMCAVSNGAGNASANVTAVMIVCANKLYTIAGTVGGLNGTVILQNNGVNNLSLSANGNFTFSVPVSHGATYTVTVQTQPIGQTCAVTNAAGTALANVTNVAVACTTNTYTVGGTLSGLNGTVVLQNNAGNNLTVSSNGSFTFTAPISHGVAYTVTVLTQPAGQMCAVSNGAGNALANVSNVMVVCTNKLYNIAGTLSGLNGTVVLQNNGGNNLSLSANGNFTFTVPVPHGSAYNVTVLTQPNGQTCSVTNGSGTATANVGNVGVDCVYPQLAANGKSLVVTTDNFIATFAGADLVGLQNRLTGETYLKNPSAGQLATVSTMTSTGQQLQTSNWSVVPEAGTGEPLATITVGDTVRTLTLKVKIDSASQEVIVRSSATVTTQGLRDASWSIAGLDFSAGKLIVPSNTGQVFDAAHSPLGAYIVYPNTWHAQMFVYEAAQGSFLVYSTDPQFRFKDLRSTSRGHTTADIAVVTEAAAPFTTATVVPEIEWRLKAFAGNWRSAAQVYRNWLGANRPVVPDTAHPWVENIRTVVSMHPVDESQLATLAARFVPAQTLIYVSDWRASAYDVNYPDYTPAASVASFMTTAHNLGFKVMLHFDLIGVSPGNAAYSSVQGAQVKAADNLALQGWNWSCGSCATRFAFINPASSTFRSLLISRIATAVNAVHPDALHLDVSGPMYNDGNGLIEGKTYPQGSMQLHDDLVAAFPSLALGGEGENDVLYGYQSFAQAWFDANDGTPGHPIVNFLFHPTVQFYGHLGQPSATDGFFKTHLSALEHRSITPNLTVYSATDLDLSLPDNARLIGLLQNWQTNGFQPDWNSNWGSSLVHYAGSGGQTADFTDNGTLEALTASGTPLYQLSHNVNQLVSSSYIPSWPAFDSSNLYGLDPTRKYFLDAVARPATTHATSLPAGSVLGANTLVTSKFALFDLGTAVTTPFDFQNLFGANLGIRYQGSDGPLANGALVFSGSLTVGGVTRQGVYIEPPWQAQFGGESFAEYLVPVQAGAQFRFSVGVMDFNTCNVDGVTFRVTVNNVEVYRQTYLRDSTWHDGTVDLSAYANSTVALRIISNPGANTACDAGGWSQPSLAYPPAAVPTGSVPLTLASGSTFSGFAGDGASSYSSGTVSNLPLPGKFVVFSQPGAAVVNGTNLGNLSFETWSGVRGEMVTPGGVFGAGTVGGATAGGVTKNPAINAHPPSNGRATLSWTVRVPDAPAVMKLGWAAGMIDSFSDDGVDFSVWINGVPYWQATRQSAAWFLGSLELQRWQGQNILLQLVTDSRANNSSDHAYWGDLILANSSATCAYSVPAQATVAAAGTTTNLAVTATTACPWAASSSVSWITINAGGSSSGSGTVSYTVAPNTGAPRTGSVLVGGQTFLIKQADPGGNFPP